MCLFPAVRGCELVAHVELVDKDRPVLAAAIRLRCDALITGDRTHFGHLYGKAVAGVLVLSPTEAVALISGTR